MIVRDKNCESLEHDGPVHFSNSTNNKRDRRNALTWSAKRGESLEACFALLQKAPPSMVTAAISPHATRPGLQWFVPDVSSTGEAAADTISSIATTAARFIEGPIRRRVWLPIAATVRADLG